MSPNTHGQESVGALSSTSRCISGDSLHSSKELLALAVPIATSSLPTFEPKSSNNSHHNRAGLHPSIQTIPSQLEDNRTGNEFLDYFNGRNVLITGGTGFVGKVLIEKLLYEFRNIGAIYIMLRPKAGKPIRKRLEEMIEGLVFERVRKECPQQFLKLTPIAGDVGFPGLGINPMDMHTIIDNVSVIFHSAATIRFDDTFSYALQINTLGTKRMLQLAQKLRHLSSFVHVSTAYCNVDPKSVEERVYFEPVSPDRVIEMSEWMDEEALNGMAPSLYRGRPSSYHYTKALAENLVAQEVHNGYHRLDERTGRIERHPFPVAIVRPSIITASWKDPLPGWVDNYYGTSGFMIVSGKGVLRTVHCNGKYKVDLIPVDIVINTCLASAWYVGSGRWQRHVVENREVPDRDDEHMSSDVFVVNCCSGHLNPITWGEMNNMTLPFYLKYPSSEIFRVPGVRYHRTQLMHQLNIYVEHIIPAYVVDFIFKFTGHSPVLDQVYQKVHRTINAFEYFTTNEWNFRGDHMTQLEKAVNDAYRASKRGPNECVQSKSRLLSHLLEPEELEASEILFPKLAHPFTIDPSHMEWLDYLEIYILGIRKYLCNEPPSSIPEARRQLYLIQLVTFLGKMLTTTTVSYQLIYPRSFARIALRRMMALVARSRQSNALL